MPTPVPVAEFSDLMNAGLRILEHREATELEVKRFHVAAEKYGKIDLQQSLCLHGLAYALEGKVPELTRTLRLALGPHGGNTTVLVLATALEYLGEYDAAKGVIEEFADQILQDSAHTDAARSILGRMGFVVSCKKFSAPESSPGEGANTLTLESLKDVFGASAFGENDLSEAVKFIRTYLRAREIHMLTQNVSMVSTEAKRRLLYLFVCDVPAADLVELEFDVYLAMGERDFPIETSGAVAFGLTVQSAAESRGNSLSYPIRQSVVMDI